MAAATIELNDTTSALIPAAAQRRTAPPAVRRNRSAIGRREDGWYGGEDIEVELKGPLVAGRRQPVAGEPESTPLSLRAPVLRPLSPVPPGPTSASRRPRASDCRTDRASYAPARSSTRHRPCAARPSSA